MSTKFLSVKEPDSWWPRTLCDRSKLWTRGGQKRLVKPSPARYEKHNSALFFRRVSSILGGFLLVVVVSLTYKKVPTNTSFVAVFKLVEFQSWKQSQIFAIRLVTKTKGWNWKIVFCIKEVTILPAIFCYLWVYFWAISKSFRSSSNCLVQP